MFRIEIHPGIWKFDSGKPGNTVVIMAGMDGKDYNKSETIRDFLEGLEIVSGKMYYIAAHPIFFKKGRERIKKSMNEAFIDIPKNSTHEDMRAHDIIQFLKESDILLTIGYEEKESFLCTKDSQFFKFFDTKYTFTGMESLKPERSESYMNRLGKIGIYLGTGTFIETSIRRNIQNFLIATENIDGEYSLYGNQKNYHLYKTLRAPDLHFSFTKKWKEIGEIRIGQEIAFYDDMIIRSPRTGILAFPRVPKKIGDTMCFLGERRI